MWQRPRSRGRPRARHTTTEVDDERGARRRGARRRG